MLPPPPPPPPPSNAISVSFSDQSPNEYNAAPESHYPLDKAEIWYTGEDFSSFRRSARGSSDDVSAASRQNLIQGVLSLQCEQQKLGIACDAKGLAKLSKSCSKEARLRAHQAADRVAWEITNPKIPFEQRKNSFKVPSSMRSPPKMLSRKRIIPMTATSA